MNRAEVNAALQGYSRSPDPTNTSSNMKKCYIASNGTASPAHANCGQLREKVSEGNHVTLRVQNRDSKSRPAPGHVRTVSDPQQRRRSEDYCRCGTSPVITVTKNRKEPLPPQRGLSVLRPQMTASQHPLKRYSLPAIGGPTRLSSSSSSSSSPTSSCSSPPAVPTSAITGRDPLGWKMRPKYDSPRPRANRLSLQIPLPVILPEPQSSLVHTTNLGPSPVYTANPDPSPVNTANPDPSPVYTTNPDPSPTNGPLHPQPSRRRHSDSSAFLGSTPLPAVTLEELCAVSLRPLSLLSDTVFLDGEAKATARTPPPPVPEKTAKARQIAQLMAQSHQRGGPADGEIIYARVLKLKAQQTEERSSLNARTTGGVTVVTAVCVFQQVCVWRAAATESGLRPGSPAEETPSASKTT